MSASEDKRQPFVEPMTALQSCIFEGEDWANVARLARLIETMALKRAILQKILNGQKPDEQ